MIIVKGTNVQLDLDNEESFSFPPGWAMVHDPEGEVLRSCSAYIVAPSKNSQNARGSERQRISTEAKRYFQSPSATEVRFVRPSVNDRDWKVLEGKAIRIFYDREGETIFGRRVHSYKEKVPVLVDKKTGTFRLEMPDRCLWNWRGFVSP